MDGRVSRAACWTCLAIAAAAVPACEDVRVAARPVVPAADAGAWKQAQEQKERGLDTAKARAEYVRILVDSCEKMHDPRACIEAATVDKRLGRTLLFHGCSLGEDAACAAYMKAEMEDDKRDRTHALADAQQALALGCAYASPNACTLLSRWNGASSAPNDVGVAPSGHGYAGLHVEDLQIAQLACVLACTEEQKGCTSRCSRGPEKPRDCSFGCSGASLMCARGCREAAAEACSQLPREDCTLLKGP